MDISQVAARAREITEQEMSLLESWIRHNSYSQEVDRVNELGEKISTSISALGLHLEKRQDETGVYHYLMSTEKWQQEPGILLVGHHDTVFPPGYFETWQVSGDEMHGPGVIDMKGGLFVAYAAIKALSENRALDRSLAMILVGDEEIGS